MFSEFQKGLKKFYHSPPGLRFQQLYHRRHQTNKSFIRRIAFILTGLLLLPIGVIFWFIPGSGWLIIFIGLALLSGESKDIARFLDFLELKTRKLIKPYISKKNN
ncbi:MAG: PGPGW domain-containing protein [bacterium]